MGEIKNIEKVWETKKGRMWHTFMYWYKFAYPF